jgi:hypothetical protein
MTEAALIIGGFTVFCVLAALLFRYCVPPASRQAIGHMLKIVLAGAQILTAIPAVFDVKMPATFEDFLTKMNFIK